MTIYSIIVMTIYNIIVMTIYSIIVMTIYSILARAMIHIRQILHVSNAHPLKRGIL